MIKYTRITLDFKEMCCYNLNGDTALKLRPKLGLKGLSVAELILQRQFLSDTTRTRFIFNYYVPQSI